MALSSQVLILLRVGGLRKAARSGKRAKRQPADISCQPFKGEPF